MVIVSTVLDGRVESPSGSFDPGCVQDTSIDNDVVSTCGDWAWFSLDHCLFDVV